MIPQLKLGVLEALGHKVDGLVGLVLVRLHGTLFGNKRPVLWLVRQRVLDREVGDRSAGETFTNSPILMCEQKRESQTHHKFPIRRQQPGAVGLHCPILFAEAKLYSEPVQLHTETYSLVTMKKDYL